MRHGKSSARRSEILHRRGSAQETSEQLFRQLTISRWGSLHNSQVIDLQHERPPRSSGIPGSLVTPRVVQRFRCDAPARCGCDGCRAMSLHGYVFQSPCEISPDASALVPARHAHAWLRQPSSVEEFIFFAVASHLAGATRCARLHCTPCTALGMVVATNRELLVVARTAHRHVRMTCGPSPLRRRTARLARCPLRPAVSDAQIVAVDPSAAGRRCACAVCRPAHHRTGDGRPGLDRAVCGPGLVAMGRQTGAIPAQARRQPGARHLSPEHCRRHGRTRGRHRARRPGCGKPELRRHPSAHAVRTERGHFPARSALRCADPADPQQRDRIASAVRQRRRCDLARGQQLVPLARRWGHRAGGGGQGRARP